MKEIPNFDGLSLKELSDAAIDLRVAIKRAMIREFGDYCKDAVVSRALWDAMTKADQCSSSIDCALER